MMNQPNQTQVNIDIGTLDNVQCEKCNNILFQPVFVMKRVSALVSPTGQEGVIPIQVFACANCGTVNKEMLPDGAGPKTPPPTDGIVTTKF